MKRTTIILATLALLIGSAAFAQGRGFRGRSAHPKAMGMQQGPGQGFDALAQYLGLTDAQKTEWQNLREATKTTVQPLMEQGRSIRDQIHTALQDGNADPTAVGKLVVQKYQIGQQIRAAHDKLQADLKATLTADQQVKFDAFNAARQAMGRGPGRGPGPGPGPGGPCPNCD